MNTVFGINGPVVTVLGNTGLSMMEMVPSAVQSGA